MPISTKQMLAEIAGRDSDPLFYNALNVLPNPDPILRRLHYAHEAYDAVMNDSHVAGEIRSIRAEFLSYQLRVVSNADKANEKTEAARQLCNDLLTNHTPSNTTSWSDVIWNMATSIFYGFRVHEVIWDKRDDFIVPVAVKDRPNRRFVFDTENKLRILTRGNQTQGIEAEDYKFIITRHMPSSTNPYGRALLSSCFWPYVFKTDGLKFFYEFCRRHGKPWITGKYPSGTSQAKQDELIKQLVKLADGNAGVMPDDSDITLVEPKAQGDLAQQELVNLCNREISKALTSQTLATEIGTIGSNAASKTHNERQMGVQQADRSIPIDAMNLLFKWITMFNFGDDVTPPKLEFYKPKNITESRIKAYELALRTGQVSKKGMLEEFNIPMAQSDDDRLIVNDHNTNNKAQNSKVALSEHICGSDNILQFSDNNINNSMSEAVASNADKIIEQDYLNPIQTYFNQGLNSNKTLVELQQELPQVFSSIDESRLEKLTDKAVTRAFADGFGDEG